MRSLLAVGAALGCFAATRLVHDAAADQRATWPEQVDLPYAPSPQAAPFVFLGYREVGADLMWIRTLAYFGGDDDTAEGLEGLIEALVALDPELRRAYEWAPRAIGWVDRGATVDDHLWAAGLLERGMARFPDRYQLPLLAGQVYALDLETDDPALRAEWDERAANHLDHAIRMPGAPRTLAALVAHLRTGLGQQERAARDLQELILTTDDPRTRAALIDRLAALEQANADRIAFEYEEVNARFKDAWNAALPQVPAEMFVLVGPPPPPAFELGDLAVGGAQVDEPLPEYDPPPE